MKKVKDLTNVDVWKEKEVCRYEDDYQLMFLAPSQSWSDRAKQELRANGVYYSGGSSAVMRYGDWYVVGHEDDGFIRFKKCQSYVYRETSKPSYYAYESTYTMHNLANLSRVIQDALRMSQEENYE